MGSDTSVHTTSDKGNVGDELPRHWSLRINVSPGFRGSAQQTKEARRWNWSSGYSPSKSAAMEEDSGDGESSQN